MNYENINRLAQDVDFLSFAGSMSFEDVDNLTRDQNFMSFAGSRNWDAFVKSEMSTEFSTRCKDSQFWNDLVKTETATEISSDSTGFFRQKNREAVLNDVYNGNHMKSMAMDLLRVLNGTPLFVRSMEKFAAPFRENMETLEKYIDKVHKTNKFPQTRWIFRLLQRYFAHEWEVSKDSKKKNELPCWILFSKLLSFTDTYIAGKKGDMKSKLFLLHVITSAHRSYELPMWYWQNFAERIAPHLHVIKEIQNLGRSEPILIDDLWFNEKLSDLIQSEEYWTDSEDSDDSPKGPDCKNTVKPKHKAKKRCNNEPITEIIEIDDDSGDDGVAVAKKPAEVLDLVTVKDEDEVVFVKHDRDLVRKESKRVSSLKGQDSKTQEISGPNGNQSDKNKNGTVRNSKEEVCIARIEILDEVIGGKRGVNGKAGGNTDVGGVVGTDGYIDVDDGVDNDRTECNVKSEASSVQHDLFEENRSTDSLAQNCKPDSTNGLIRRRRNVSRKDSSQCARYTIIETIVIDCVDSDDDTNDGDNTYQISEEVCHQTKASSSSVDNKTENVELVSRKMEKVTEDSNKKGHNTASFNFPDENISKLTLEVAKVISEKLKDCQSSTNLSALVPKIVGETKHVTRTKPNETEIVAPPRTEAKDGSTSLVNHANPSEVHLINKQSTEPDESITKISSMVIEALQNFATLRSDKVRQTFGLKVSSADTNSRVAFNANKKVLKAADVSSSIITSSTECDEESNNVTEVTSSSELGNKLNASSTQKKKFCEKAKAAHKPAPMILSKILEDGMTKTQEGARTRTKIESPRSVDMKVILEDQPTTSSGKQVSTPGSEDIPDKSDKPADETQKFPESLQSVVSKLVKDQSVNESVEGIEDNESVENNSIGKSAEDTSIESTNLTIGLKIKSSQSSEPRHSDSIDDKPPTSVTPRIELLKDLASKSVNDDKQVKDSGTVTIKNISVETVKSIEETKIVEVKGESVSTRKITGSIEYTSTKSVEAKATDFIKTTSTVSVDKLQTPGLVESVDSNESVKELVTKRTESIEDGIGSTVQDEAIQLVEDETTESIEAQTLPTVPIEIAKSVERKTLLEEKLIDKAAKLIDHGSAESVDEKVVESVGNKVRKSVEDGTNKFGEGTAAKSVEDTTLKSVVDKTVKSVENKSVELVRKTIDTAENIKTVQDNTTRSDEDKTIKLVEVVHPRGEKYKLRSEISTRSAEDKMLETTTDESENSVEDNTNKPIKNKKFVKDKTTGTVKDKTDETVNDKPSTSVENKSTEKIKDKVDETISNSTKLVYKISDSVDKSSDLIGDKTTDTTEVKICDSFEKKTTELCVGTVAHTTVFENKPRTSEKIELSVGTVSGKIDATIKDNQPECDKMTSVSDQLETQFVKKIEEFTSAIKDNECSSGKIGSVKDESVKSTKLTKGDIIESSADKPSNFEEKCNKIVETNEERTGKPLPNEKVQNRVTSNAIQEPSNKKMVQECNVQETLLTKIKSQADSSDRRLPMCETNREPSKSKWSHTTSSVKPYRDETNPEPLNDEKIQRLTTENRSFDQFLNAKKRQGLPTDKNSSVDEKANSKLEGMQDVKKSVGEVEQVTSIDKKGTPKSILEGLREPSVDKKKESVKNTERQESDDKLAICVPSTNSEKELSSYIGLKEDKPVESDKATSVKSVKDKSADVFQLFVKHEQSKKPKEISSNEIKAADEFIKSSKDIFTKSDEAPLDSVDDTSAKCLALSKVMFTKLGKASSESDSTKSVDLNARGPENFRKSPKSDETKAIKSVEHKSEVFLSKSGRLLSTDFIVKRSDKYTKSSEHKHPKFVESKNKSVEPNKIESTGSALKPGKLLPPDQTVSESSESIGNKLTPSTQHKKTESVEDLSPKSEILISTDLGKVKLLESGKINLPKAKFEEPERDGAAKSAKEFLSEENQVSTSRKIKESVVKPHGEGKQGLLDDRPKRSVVELLSGVSKQSSISKIKQLEVTPIGEGEQEPSEEKTKQSVMEPLDEGKEKPWESVMTQSTSRMNRKSCLISKADGQHTKNDSVILKMSVDVLSVKSQGTVKYNKTEEPVCLNTKGLTYSSDDRPIQPLIAANKISAAIKSMVNNEQTGTVINSQASQIEKTGKPLETTQKSSVVQSEIEKVKTDDNISEHRSKSDNKSTTNNYFSESTECVEILHRSTDVNVSSKCSEVSKDEHLEQNSENIRKQELKLVDTSNTKDFAENILKTDSKEVSKNVLEVDIDEVRIQHTDEAVNNVDVQETVYFGPVECREVFVGHEVEVVSCVEEKDLSQLLGSVESGESKNEGATQFTINILPASTDLELPHPEKREVMDYLELEHLQPKKLPENKPKNEVRSRFKVGNQFEAKKYLSKKKKEERKMQNKTVNMVNLENKRITRSCSKSQKFIVNDSLEIQDPNDSYVETCRTSINDGDVKEACSPNKTKKKTNASTNDCDVVNLQERTPKKPNKLKRSLKNATIKYKHEKIGRKKKTRKQSMTVDVVTPVVDETKLLPEKRFLDSLAANDDSSDSCEGKLIIPDEQSQIEIINEHPKKKQEEIKKSAPIFIRKMCDSVIQPEPVPAVADIVNKPIVTLDVSKIVDDGKKQTNHCIDYILAGNLVKSFVNAETRTEEKLPIRTKAQRKSFVKPLNEELETSKVCTSVETGDTVEIAGHKINDTILEKQASYEDKIETSKKPPKKRWEMLSKSNNTEAASDVCAEVNIKKTTQDESIVAREVDAAASLLELSRVSQTVEQSDNVDSHFGVASEKSTIPVKLLTLDVSLPKVEPSKQAAVAAHKLKLNETVSRLKEKLAIEGNVKAIYKSKAIEHVLMKISCDNEDTNISQPTPVEDTPKSSTEISCCNEDTKITQPTSIEDVEISSTELSCEEGVKSSQLQPVQDMATSSTKMGPPISSMESTRHNKDTDISQVNPVKDIAPSSMTISYGNEKMMGVRESSIDGEEKLVNEDEDLKANLSKTVVGFVERKEHVVAEKVQKEENESELPETSVEISSLEKLYQDNTKDQPKTTVNVISDAILVKNIVGSIIAEDVTVDKEENKLRCKGIIEAQVLESQPAVVTSKKPKSRNMGRKVLSQTNNTFQSELVEIGKEVEAEVSNTSEDIIVDVSNFEKSVDSTTEDNVDDVSDSKKCVDISEINVHDECLNSNKYFDKIKGESTLKQQLESSFKIKGVDKKDILSIKGTQITTEEDKKDNKIDLMEELLTPSIVTDTLVKPEDIPSTKESSSTEQISSTSKISSINVILNTATVIEKDKETDLMKDLQIPSTVALDTSIEISSTEKELQETSALIEKNKETDVAELRQLSSIKADTFDTIGSVMDVQTSSDKDNIGKEMDVKKIHKIDNLGNENRNKQMISDTLDDKKEGMREIKLDSAAMDMKSHKETTKRKTNMSKKIKQEIKDSQEIDKKKTHKNISMEVLSESKLEIAKLDEESGNKKADGFKNISKEATTETKLENRKIVESEKKRKPDEVLELVSKEVKPEPKLDKSEIAEERREKINLVTKGSEIKLDNSKIAEKSDEKIINDGNENVSKKVEQEIKSSDRKTNEVIDKIKSNDGNKKVLKEVTKETKPGEESEKQKSDKKFPLEIEPGERKIDKKREMKSATKKSELKFGPDERKPNRESEIKVTNKKSELKIIIDRCDGKNWKENNSKSSYKEGQMMKSKSKELEDLNLRTNDSKTSKKLGRSASVDLIKLRDADCKAEKTTHDQKRDKSRDHEKDSKHRSKSREKGRSDIKKDKSSDRRDRRSKSRVRSKSPARSPKVVNDEKSDAAPVVRVEASEKTSKSRDKVLKEHRDDKYPDNKRELKAEKRLTKKTDQKTEIKPEKPLKDNDNLPEIVTEQKDVNKPVEKSEVNAEKTLNKKTDERNDAKTEKIPKSKDRPSKVITELKDYKKSDEKSVIKIPTKKPDENNEVKTISKNTEEKSEIKILSKRNEEKSEVRTVKTSKGKDKLPKVEQKDEIVEVKAEKAPKIKDKDAKKSGDKTPVTKTNASSRNRREDEPKSGKGEVDDKKCNSTKMKESPAQRTRSKSRDEKTKQNVEAVKRKRVDDDPVKEDGRDHKRRDLKKQEDVKSKLIKLDKLNKPPKDDKGKEKNDVQEMELKVKEEKRLCKSKDKLDEEKDGAQSTAIRVKEEKKVTKSNVDKLNKDKNVDTNLKVKEEKKPIKSKDIDKLEEEKNYIQGTVLKADKSETVAINDKSVDLALCKSLDNEKLECIGNKPKHSKPKGFESSNEIISKKSSKASKYKSTDRVNVNINKTSVPRLSAPLDTNLHELNSTSEVMMLRDEVKFDHKISKLVNASMKSKEKDTKKGENLNRKEEPNKSTLKIKDIKLQIQEKLNFGREKSSKVDHESKLKCEQKIAQNKQEETAFSGKLKKGETLSLKTEEPMGKLKKDECLSLKKEKPKNVEAEVTIKEIKMRIQEKLSSSDAKSSQEAKVLNKRVAKKQEDFKSSERQNVVSNIKLTEVKSTIITDKVVILGMQKETKDANGLMLEKKGESKVNQKQEEIIFNKVDKSNEDIKEPNSSQEGKVVNKQEAREQKEFKSSERQEEMLNIKLDEITSKSNTDITVNLEMQKEIKDANQLALKKKAESKEIQEQGKMSFKKKAKQSNEDANRLLLENEKSKVIQKQEMYLNKEAKSNVNILDKSNKEILTEENLKTQKVAILQNIKLSNETSKPENSLDTDLTFAHEKRRVLKRMRIDPYIDTTKNDSLSNKFEAYRNEILDEKFSKPKARKESFGKDRPKNIDDIINSLIENKQIGNNNKIKRVDDATKINRKGATANDSSVEVKNCDGMVKTDEKKPPKEVETQGVQDFEEVEARKFEAEGDASSGSKLRNISKEIQVQKVKQHVRNISETSLEMQETEKDHQNLTGIKATKFVIDPLKIVGSMTKNVSAMDQNLKEVQAKKFVVETDTSSVTTKGDVMPAITKTSLQMELQESQKEHQCTKEAESSKLAIENDKSLGSTSRNVSPLTSAFREVKKMHRQLEENNARNFEMQTVKSSRNASAKVARMDEKFEVKPRSAIEALDVVKMITDDFSEVEEPENFTLHQHSVSSREIEDPIIIPEIAMQKVTTLLEQGILKNMKPPNVIVEKIPILHHEVMQLDEPVRSDAMDDLQLMTEPSLLSDDLYMTKGKTDMCIVPVSAIEGPTNIVAVLTPTSVGLDIVNKIGCNQLVAPVMAADTDVTVPTLGCVPDLHVGDVGDLQQSNKAGFTAGDVDDTPLSEKVKAIGYQVTIGSSEQTSGVGGPFLNEQVSLKPLGVIKGDKLEGSGEDLDDSPVDENVIFPFSEQVCLENNLVQIESGPLDNSPVDSTTDYQLPEQDGHLGFAFIENGLPQDVCLIHPNTGENMFVPHVCKEETVELDEDTVNEFSCEEPSPQLPDVFISDNDNPRRDEFSLSLMSTEQMNECMTRQSITEKIDKLDTLTSGDYIVDRPVEENTKTNEKTGHSFYSLGIPDHSFVSIEASKDISNLECAQPNEKSTNLDFTVEIPLPIHSSDTKVSNDLEGNLEPCVSAISRNLTGDKVVGVSMKVQESGSKPSFPMANMSFTDMEEVKYNEEVPTTIWPQEFVMRNKNDSWVRDPLRNIQMLNRTVNDICGQIHRDDENLLQTPRSIPAALETVILPDVVKNVDNPNPVVETKEKPPTPKSSKKSKQRLLNVLNSNIIQKPIQLKSEPQADMIRVRTYDRSKVLAPVKHRNSKQDGEQVKSSDSEPSPGTSITRRSDNPGSPEVDNVVVDRVASKYGKKLSSDDYDPTKLRNGPKRRLSRMELNGDEDAPPKRSKLKSDDDDDDFLPSNRKKPNPVLTDEQLSDLFNQVRESDVNSLPILNSSASKDDRPRRRSYSNNVNYEVLGNPKKRPRQTIIDPNEVDSNFEKNNPYNPKNNIKATYRYYTSPHVPGNERPEKTPPVTAMCTRSSGFPRVLRSAQLRESFEGERVNILARLPSNKHDTPIAKVAPLKRQNGGGSAHDGLLLQNKFKQHADLTGPSRLMSSGSRRNSRLEEMKRNGHPCSRSEGRRHTEDNSVYHGNSFSRQQHFTDQSSSERSQEKNRWIPHADQQPSSLPANLRLGPPKKSYDLSKNDTEWRHRLSNILPEPKVSFQPLSGKRN